MSFDLEAFGVDRLRAGEMPRCTFNLLCNCETAVSTLVISIDSLSLSFGTEALTFEEVSILRSLNLPFRNDENKSELFCTVAVVLFDCNAIFIVPPCRNSVIAVVDVATLSASASCQQFRGEGCPCSECSNATAFALTLAALDIVRRCFAFRVAMVSEKKLDESDIEGLIDNIELFGLGLVLYRGLFAMTFCINTPIRGDVIGTAAVSLLFGCIVWVEAACNTLFARGVTSVTGVERDSVGFDS